MTTNPAVIPASKIYQLETCLQQSHAIASYVMKKANEDKSKMKMTHWFGRTIVFPEYLKNLTLYLRLSGIVDPDFEVDIPKEGSWCIHIPLWQLDGWFVSVSCCRAFDGMYTFANFPPEIAIIQVTKGKKELVTVPHILHGPPKDDNGFFGDPQIRVVDYTFKDSCSKDLDANSLRPTWSPLFESCYSQQHVMKEINLHYVNSKLNFDTVPAWDFRVLAGAIAGIWDRIFDAELEKHLATGNVISLFRNGKVTIICRNSNSRTQEKGKVTDTEKLEV